MDDDHIIEPHTNTLHTRRQFLRTSMLGAAVSYTLPVFLQKTFFTLDAMAADSALQTPTGKDDTILIVLQLAGGNDGMNMVIPYGDDAYYKARPVIAIPKNTVIPVSDYVGLNPKLTGLKGLYDQGHLAILQGVGYPNPNRSHFRSTEIWQTASDSDKSEPYGWLGRYFDSCCKGADPTVGVAIGNQVPQSFASAEPTGVSFSQPQQYRWVNGDPSADAKDVYREMNEPDMTPQQLDENDGGSVDMLPGHTAPNRHESTLEFLQRTALDAQMSSDKILDIAKKYPASVSYPQTALGDSLSLVGRMIAGGLPTRVYYVSQGGYDTHVNETPTHTRLMGELNNALVAFAQDMTAQGNFGRVLVMTFSEFGRRVTQNASNGTDHGAAAPMFVMGGAMKPGLIGAYPSLTNLFQGDLTYNVDFRGVYATILDKWLRAPSKEILGKQFEHVGILT
jgi:uncharacterized protein (DUF1501 family)